PISADSEFVEIFGLAVRIFGSCEVLTSPSVDTPHIGLAFSKAFGW
ncbi:hypothetical protein JL09_g6834, partial [Pichia kudriavzevii]